MYVSLTIMYIHMYICTSINNVRRKSRIPSKAMKIRLAPIPGKATDSSVDEKNVIP